MSRLAVVATHPIQYQAPWFRALAAEPGLDLEVYFCHRASPRDQADAGFGVEFTWDTSLLEGYRYRFLENTAARPGLDRFGGLDTPEIAGIVRQGRFDAVLVSGWSYKSAWQAFWACWRSGTPLLVRGDSHLRTPRSAATRTVKRLAYRAFIPRFDACLAAGRWSADYYQHYGARPERIFLVPHVVDEAWFAAQRAQLEAKRATLRQRWGLDRNAAVFLFVGKLLAGKRPLDFVRAIGAARQANGSVTGLVVGDGPLRAACEQEAASRQLPIRFAGFLNQRWIPAAYLAADALVVPSAAETWGLVVNEAMTCGRPCFVSDQVGCGPDLIVADTTGAVFPLGDVAGLGALLAHYAADLPRLQTMGQAALAHLGGYSLRVAVDGVLAALAAVRRR